MSKRYVEIETKYNAEDISLISFSDFCESKSPHNKIVASGFDRFYENKSDPDSFCRHRNEPGKFNQLSFKRKLTEKNNYIRTEHNISLGLEVNDDQIGAICSEFGYKYNISLFKNCFIYEYDVYTLVYYVCYDSYLKELGGFIEIEMSEGFPWESDEVAWNKLTTLETELKVIGITPQSRVKRSLFEMFRSVK